MSARHPHGPQCIACTDPAGLPARLAARRAELDAESARAAQHDDPWEAATRMDWNP